MGIKEILDARDRAIAEDRGFDAIKDSPKVIEVEEVVHCEDCDHEDHLDCEDCDCC